MCPKLYKYFGIGFTVYHFLGAFSPVKANVLRVKESVSENQLFYK